MENRLDTPCNHPIPLCFHLKHPPAEEIGWYRHKSLQGYWYHFVRTLSLSQSHGREGHSKLPSQAHFLGYFVDFFPLYLSLSWKPMDIACNALLEEIVLKCVCILCFAGESRAELQGNGDASTAAATSGSLATSASFQPSLIILTTSLTFLLTFIQAQRQQSVWTSKHPHTPSYWKARKVRLGYHPSYMIKACSKEWYNVVWYCKQLLLR